MEVARIIFHYIRRKINFPLLDIKKHIMCNWMHLTLFLARFCSQILICSQFSLAEFQILKQEKVNNGFYISLTHF